MARISLLHWKKAEAGAYLEALARARHQVEYHEKYSPELMRAWRYHPPAAFVIDLSRLPSQGREIATALRQSLKTRLIPIVFCGGEKEKVEGVRSVIPDATYCELPGLVAALDSMLKHPPASAVVPRAMMERYAGRTAAQKLGITPDCSVALIDPPRDYSHVLGDLPDGVRTFEAVPDSVPAVVLCFLYEGSELAGKIADVRQVAAHSKLWLLWRKGRSASGGISETHVREAALELGLVDYKVCSVNPVWAGMLFAERR